MSAVAEVTEQVVIFRLGSQEFGLKIDQVREIIRDEDVTPMPRAASAVAGVINVRGKVIPVVDLHSFLGFPAFESGITSRIVIVESGAALVGLRVDAATDVLRVPQGSLAPVTEILGKNGPADVVGVYKLEDRLVSLLDIKDILEIGRMDETGPDND